MKSILHSYAEMIAAREQRFQSVKPALLAALKAIGVSITEVEYDGSGDDGQIDSIRAYNEYGQQIPLKSHSISIGEGDDAESYDSLEEFIDIFAWDVLGTYHDGFVNNDGGYGTLTINVADGTITLNHKDRFIDVTVTETEI